MTTSRKLARSASFTYSTAPQMEIPGRKGRRHRKAEMHAQVPYNMTSIASRNNTASPVGQFGSNEIDPNGMGFNGIPNAMQQDNHSPHNGHPSQIQTVDPRTVMSYAQQWIKQHPRNTLPVGEHDKIVKLTTQLEKSIRHPKGPDRARRPGNQNNKKSPDFLAIKLAKEINMPIPSMHPNDTNDTATAMSQQSMASRLGQMGKPPRNGAVPGGIPGIKSPTQAGGMMPGRPGMGNPDGSMGPQDAVGGGPTRRPMMGDQDGFDGEDDFGGGLGGGGGFGSGGMNAPGNMTNGPNPSDPQTIAKVTALIRQIVAALNPADVDHVLSAVQLNLTGGGAATGVGQPGARPLGGGLQPRISRALRGKREQVAAGI